MALLNRRLLIQKNRKKAERIAENKKLLQDILASLQRIEDKLDGET
jgi:hypothetical protein